jgi:hypothetical protein
VRQRIEDNIPDNLAVVRQRHTTYIIVDCEIGPLNDTALGIVDFRNQGIEPVQENSIAIRLDDAEVLDSSAGRKRC